MKKIPFADTVQTRCILTHVVSTGRPLDDVRRRLAPASELNDVSQPVGTVRPLEEVRRPVVMASALNDVSHPVATVRPLNPVRRPEFAGAHSMESGVQ
jgi:hypothetical protein